MQQQGSTHAHSGTADCRQQRLRKGGNAMQELKDRAAIACRRVVHEITEVVASAEDGFAALDDHHTGACIVCSGFQRIGQLLVHRRRDGVFLVRAVESQGENAGFVVNENALGHKMLLI